MTHDSVIFKAIKWEVDETEDNTVIHIHGLDQQNARVVVKIPDFKPYVYLELDPAYKWTNPQLTLLKAFLRKSLHVNYPVKECLVNRIKNYYYRPGRFLWMAFNNTNGIRALERAVRGSFTLYGVGKLTLRVHEQNANPTLKLFAMRKIKPAGWICAKRTDKKKLLTEYCDTFSTADIELVSSYKGISEAENISAVVNPKILSYDIECISGDATGNTFPNPVRKTDQIICVSATVANFQDPETDWKTYILVNECKGKKQCPDEIGDGSIVRKFKNEKELLLGWTAFINEIDPDIITGYNTLSFDDNYMAKRANVNLCWTRFSKLGRLLGQRAKIEERKWSSSAYGDQKFNYIDIPGRLHIDMYPVIFKDYGNLMSYTLDYVSEHFLGQNKINLSAKEMIQIWHQGETDNIRRIAEYCNKDTLLPLKLMKKLNTWFGLTEMANVVMVQIFDLITRGQQIRVFSQVYCLAYELGVVCTSKWSDYRPPDSEKEFVGATVQNPKTGYWELVVTYDFKSLYPTTIMAYNLCFSTFIPNDAPLPPPEQYHDLQWEEHVGCVHDTAIRKTKIAKKICRTHHYRFYKANIKKGIIPMLLDKLLTARANTRKEIKGLVQKLKTGSLTEEETKQTKLLIDVLDKRQLGYKISANSMYGGFGSDFSYTPFYPAAASTTAMGRKSIQDAIDFAKEFRNDTVLVYGDSVTSDTPVLLRDPNGKIIINQISLLAKEQTWTQYCNYKPSFIEPIDSSIEYHVADDGPSAILAARHMFNANKRFSKEQKSLHDSGWEVWTDSGWSTIKRIIRHKTLKKIYRVTTPTGTVDVTQDHSLLTADKKQIKPVDVKIGDSLLHSFPEFEEICSCVNSKPGCSACKMESQYIITEDEAEVWGLFMANGSCKTSWSISNNNIDLLLKIQKKLNNIEPSEFKINTDGVCKLIPIGKSIQYLTDKYTLLFYDEEMYKVVPQLILNSSKNILTAFWKGYCSSNSHDAISSISLDVNSKISAQSLWYIGRKLGYKTMHLNTSTNDPIYHIQASKSEIYINQRVVTQIQPLGVTSDYVYDLETVSGRFQAGVGELIVKNTDSCMLHFSTIRDLKTCFQVAENLETAINTIFPKPMYLEMEKIYSKYFLVSKKRYVGEIVDVEGKLLSIDKKGVVIKRRDNCAYLREIYSQLIEMIMSKRPRWKMYEYLRGKVRDLLAGNVDLEQLVITKSIKDSYKATNLPHLAVATKMRDRGKYVASGTRIRYIFTVTENKNDPQYRKAEDPDYYLQHQDVVKIDYLYYFEKQLVNPIDEIFEVKFGVVNVLKNLLRLVKKDAIKNIDDYFCPKFKIID